MTGGDTTRGDTKRVVGRIGRPHGLRGEVMVAVHTDFPEQRFALGSQLCSDTGRTLTVEAVRPHKGALLVRFSEVADREAAAELRGHTLRIDAAELPELDDPDEFYDHQLVGLAAYDEDGTAIGTVAGLLHGGAQDLLRITTSDGREALVPFVKALVPEVDVAGGRVVIADRPGLVTPLPEDAQ
jgi:16S rRNA processing protein RimM